MIYGITGYPGAGKSRMLVYLAKRFLERGIDVYSNVIIDFSRYPLKAKRRKSLGNFFYWQSLSQFRNIHNGIVLLDEAGSYFEPREWAKFDIADRVKFQQHRKQLLDIYLTVQDFGRVDLTIRQLTPFIYEVGCFPSPSKKDFSVPSVKKHPWFFFIRKYNSADIDLKKRKNLSWRIQRFNRKLCECYNTYQSVNLRSIVNYRFKKMEEVLQEINPQ